MKRDVEVKVLLDSGRGVNCRGRPLLSNLCIHTIVCFLPDYNLTCLALVLKIPSRFLVFSASQVHTTVYLYYHRRKSRGLFLANKQQYEMFW